MEIQTCVCLYLLYILHSSCLNFPLPSLILSFSDCIFFLSFFHDSWSCLFIWPLCLLLPHFISSKYSFCQLHPRIFFSSMCLKPFDVFEVSLLCSVLNPTAVCVLDTLCVRARGEERGGVAGLQCVCVIVYTACWVWWCQCVFVNVCVSEGSRQCKRDWIDGNTQFRQLRHPSLPPFPRLSSQSTPPSFPLPSFFSSFTPPLYLSSSLYFCSLLPLLVFYFLSFFHLVFFSSYAATHSDVDE